MRVRGHAKGPGACGARPSAWSSSTRLQLAGGGAVGVVLVLLLPGEERTQLLAGGLDRVCGTLLAELEELLAPGILVLDEAVGERTGLDVSENRLHVLLHRRVDDARSRHVVAVLCGVGDRPALLGDAALPHQVDDELQLVQHLEVGDLWLVTGLDQRLEAVLHQLGSTTAQHGLLTEQVGLGLLGERRLDAAGAQSADRLRVRPGEVPGRAGCVLLDSDDDGNATPSLVLTANRVAWTLRGNHDDVDTFRGFDVTEADVETVAEQDGLAICKVRLDVVGIEVALVLVGCEDDDDVGPFSRLSRAQYLEAGFLGLGNRLRAFLQANDNVDARVAQVLRVGVALRAVADDGNLLALDDRQVGVFVVRDFGHYVYSLIVEVRCLVSTSSTGLDELDPL